MTNKAQTSTGYFLQDPEVKELLGQLRAALTQEPELDIQTYSQMQKKDVGLPSVNRIYRFFGDFDEAMRYARQPAARSGPRFSHEELIESVRYVADQLGTSILSSSAYETYCRRKAPNLPSASVVRKRLGEWQWSKAMQVAGLQAPERSETKPPDQARIVRSIQMASLGRGPLQPLNQRDYNRFAVEHPNEDHPDLMQILEVYGTWEAALHAANVELEDDLHESGWTIQEARWSLQQVQRFVGGPVTRSTYERTRARARRSMPTWDEVLMVLHLSEDKTGKVVTRSSIQG